jgi:3-methyl-2-oxobutanoate hydroxymethyltransferase
MVREHIPEELGTKITREVGAVTIGIGGGHFTDGQVLVMHDALGMHPRKIPPFATKFVDMYSLGVEGFRKYVESVKAKI